MRNPDFSIATPVRNGKPLIGGTIRSVRSQQGVTYELLVQDSGSTDGTLEWLEACRDERIHTVSEPDEGMYDAINRAWSRAKGSYLAWINADEQYVSNALERVRRAFEMSPETDVVIGDTLIVDTLGNPIAYRREPVPRRSYIVNSFLYNYSCSMFFRRSLWDRGVLRLNDQYRYAADMDLVIRLLECDVSFKRLEVLLGVYTVTGRNLSRDADMALETLDIRRKYSSPNAVLPSYLWRVGRWIERFAIGGFQRRSGEFVYWHQDHEAPTIKVYSDIGTRYSVFVSQQDRVAG